jgi:hypothetical protein
MYKNLGILVIVLLTLILIGNIFIFNSKKAKISNQETKVNALLEEVKNYKRSYVNYSTKSFLFENYELDKNIVLVSEGGTKVSLNDLQKNVGNLIVFHFSELNCNLCVDNEIRKLRSIIKSDSTLAKRLIVISKYSKQEYLNIYKRINQVTFEIYNIEGEDIEQHSIDMPFYFVFGSDHSCRNVFIPDKHLPNVTADYLYYMKKRYITMN